MGYAGRINRKNKLIAMYGFRCAYCGLSKFRRELTADHVIPKAKGGRGVMENTLLACQPCNTRKADVPLSDWRMARLQREYPHLRLMEFSEAGIRRISD